MNITTEYQSLEKMIFELNEMDLGRIVIEHIRSLRKVPNDLSDYKIEFWDDDEYNTHCRVTFSRVASEEIKKKEEVTP